MTPQMCAVSVLSSRKTPPISAAGLFKQEPSNEEYDQFKVTERSEKIVNALTLPPNQVRKLATQAMQKRLEREKNASLVTIAKMG